MIAFGFSAMGALIELSRAKSAQATAQAQAARFANFCSQSEGDVIDVEARVVEDVHALPAPQLVREPQEAT